MFLDSNYIDQVELRGCSGTPSRSPFLDGERTANESQLNLLLEIALSRRVLPCPRAQLSPQRPPAYSDQLNTIKRSRIILKSHPMASVAIASQFNFFFCPIQLPFHTYRASLMAQQLRICLQCRRCNFNPWIRKIPWRRAWQPTPVFLPGKFHGQRRLVGYSPQGCKGQI